MSSVPAYTLLALVVLQRGAELIYSRRNVRALKARGGIEHGRLHYPVLVALHVSWLIAMALAIRRNPVIYWLPVSLFALLQLLRIWVLATLDGWWTTRIITLPEAPLVTRGPYRYVRHPNYLVVAGEVAILPLAFGQIAIAVFFSGLNLMVLAWRVHVENAALAPRR